MLKEDIRRLEREADLAKARRGPDYSIVEENIRRVKAEFRKRREMQIEADRPKGVPNQYEIAEMLREYRGRGRLW